MGAYDVIPLADVDISWEAGFFSRTQKRLEDNRRFAVTYSGIATSTTPLTSSFFYSATKICQDTSILPVDSRLPEHCAAREVPE